MISLASESIVPVRGSPQSWRRDSGVLSDAQLAVAIGKDRAIKARPDNCVLEASLQKMLNDEGLEIDFYWSSATSRLS
jgi:hypothetical protein